MKTKRKSDLEMCGKDLTAFNPNADSGSLKRRVRRQHTRIVSHSTGYCAYLTIDHQSFCVVEDTTRKRANWYRDQLAAALSRLLSSNAELSDSRPL